MTEMAGCYNPARFKITAMKNPLLQRITNFYKNLDRAGRIVLFAFLGAGLVSSFLAFSFVRNIVVSTTSFDLPGLAIDESQIDGSESTDSASTGSAQELGPELEQWDGNSRVNILVLGLDHRDWEAGSDAPRTDSMMLLTIDPNTKTAGILSIPRDLWVEIPGFGHKKINAAYQLGEQSRLPGGGTGLAIKTVEQFLGVTVHFYAQIDFVAFETFIDEIGGVKIDVEKKIKVQVIGQEKLERLLPGRYTLPGNIALAYARARNTEDGDFDRARRQQQLIFAIRDQFLRPDVQALILTDGIRLYQELSSGVNTNMTFDEMLRLGFLALDVGVDNVTSAVIAPPDYVTLAISPDGLDILKPITQNIRILRDSMFSTGSIVSEIGRTSESNTLMQSEQASIAIYNGASVAGLADTTRQYLEGLGMTVAAVSNADPVGATTIYDYTGNPYTIAFLVETMGVQPTRIYNRYNPDSQVDLEVIIGPDWSVPQ